MNSQLSGILRSSRYTGSTFCSRMASAIPPETAIQSACRTTAPAAPSWPAPRSCDTDGVTAITMPDINSISGRCGGPKVRHPLVCWVTNTFTFALRLFAAGGVAPPPVGPTTARRTRLASDKNALPQRQSYFVTQHTSPSDRR